MLIPIEASSPGILPWCRERVVRLRNCLLRNMAVDWASSTNTASLGLRPPPITEPKQAREIGFLARSGSAYWPCVEALHNTMASVLPDVSEGTQNVPLVL